MERGVGGVRDDGTDGARREDVGAASDACDARGSDASTDATWGRREAQAGTEKGWRVGGGRAGGEVL
jgi:hypothetical protein